MRTALVRCFRLVNHLIAAQNELNDLALQETEVGKTDAYHHLHDAVGDIIGDAAKQCGLFGVVPTLEGRLKELADHLGIAASEPELVLTRALGTLQEKAQTEGPPKRVSEAEIDRVAKLLADRLKDVALTSWFNLRGTAQELLENLGGVR